MLVNRVGGGSENLNPQLDTQESLLEQIKEILPFKGGMSISPELFGCTKMAIDTFKYSTDTAVDYVTHTLNEKPKYVFVRPKTTVVYNTTHSRYMHIFGMLAPTSPYHTFTYEYLTSSDVIGAGATSLQDSSYETRIPIPKSISFAANIEYEVITMA